MKNLNYEPIPQESSQFISIGIPTHMHPKGKNNEKLMNDTLEDIGFLKEELRKYLNRSTLNEIPDHIIKRKMPNISSAAAFPLHEDSKHRDKRALKCISVYDGTKRPALHKVRRKGRSSSLDLNQRYVRDSNIEKTPEFLFIKKLCKTNSMQKTTEYQKLCSDLSKIISSIIHFVEIHYDQKIPVSIDRPKFFEYCSSFFERKDYQSLVKKEEILKNKFDQLSHFAKYKVINSDQLKLKLFSLLNIQNEQNDKIKGKKKKKNKKRKRKDNINSEGEEENSIDIVCYDDDFDETDKSSHSFYNSDLDYSHYSEFDDYLFYFIHSTRFNNTETTFYESSDIEVQKIALEITGIAERNLLFKINHKHLDESAPNYTHYNEFLDQLSTMILSDENVFDFIKDKEKDKLEKIYTHQIKTVIKISLTRLIFDAAYLFNYDYLLNDHNDEKEHCYLHFNKEDVAIKINSKIIQRLLPRDLGIPDGLLIDRKICKSKSQLFLSQASSGQDYSDDDECDMKRSNSSGSLSAFVPIKNSAKTIHELMEKEEDFLIIAEKLQDLQFYTNPIDLSYKIYKIFKKIQERIAKVKALNSKKNKSNEKSMARSKSREFDPFIQFDDLFLFFLVVFTFSPPNNSRWIAAMLKRFSKLVPNMILQQSSSFFVAAVNYTSSFPQSEELSSDLMNKIDQIRAELTQHT